MESTVTHNAHKNLHNLDIGGLLLFTPIDTQRSVPFIVEADEHDHWGEARLFRLRYPTPHALQLIDRNQMELTISYYSGTITRYV